MGVRHGGGLRSSAGEKPLPDKRNGAIRSSWRISLERLEAWITRLILSRESLLAKTHRYVRADSTSLMIFRHYIVEVFMRRTASTSLRSLSVPLPFRAIHTNTKPHSRWRLPWSLDSTMYCRSLRTLNAQRCTVGPQIPNMTGHDTHKPASSTRVGIALVLTVLATGAVAAQELPRSGQAALLPPRPDLYGEKLRPQPFHRPRVDLP